MARRTGVRYAGQKGCEMTTSAVGRCCSSTQPSPSLSEVTISSTPRSSRNFFSPRAPDTEPSRWPGWNEMALGVGGVPCGATSDPRVTKTSCCREAGLNHHAAAALREQRGVRRRRRAHPVFVALDGGRLVAGVFGRVSRRSVREEDENHLWEQMF